MLLVRPIEARDIDALLVIAQATGHGFTSLPNDKNILAKKIEASVAAINLESDFAFSQTKQSYLFVLEDTISGEILGTSGIESSVGLDDAFYHYRISKVVHSSPKLGIYNPLDVLILCNDYTGATEIGSLFLAPQARGQNAGKLLSKFRFMFMAEHRNRFNSRIFAEMRGVLDESGHSPFWDWLEDNFFRIDFPTADYLSGIGNKAFIAELMPKFPIYTRLLSSKAQAVIGKVHPQTAPALSLLEAESFRFNGYIDIFDGGPTVEAELHQINSVKNSRKVSVALQTGEQAGGMQHFLICNTRVKNFRAAIAQSQLDEISNRILLSSSDAELLGLKKHDSARILALV
ncbi:arginine N-succinyltransferase [Catenovulum sediminis]|uniref:Arginine N-succinyltransferase n=1 Tax=Catenovulum sediminis TaxID=1740262 RepID=A0ABV1RE22_9ALTE|nr:arginine N-succinyltransferase [Catenovulum sediminis]